MKDERKKQNGPRKVLHVPTSGYVTGLGWRVCRITEGEKGMVATEMYLNMEYSWACAKVRSMNRQNGIVPADVTDILLSAVFNEDPTAEASAAMAGMPAVYTIRGSNPVALAKLWLAKDLGGWLKALGNQDLLTLVEDGKSWADIATNFSLSGWDIARYRIGLETLKRMGDKAGE